MHPHSVRLTEHGLQKLKRELKYLKEQYVRLSKNWRGGNFTNDPQDVTHSVELMEQSATYRHIKELEKILHQAKLIHHSKNGVIEIGSVVVIRSSKGEQKVTIVDPIETDPFNGLISIDSPLGKALSGKRVGERVAVVTPRGMREHTIIKVT